MKVMKNSGGEPGLSREDGIAALESAAAMVCGSCGRCGLKQECLKQQDGENYFLIICSALLRKRAHWSTRICPGNFWTGAGKDGLSAGIKSKSRAIHDGACLEEPFFREPDAVMLQFEEMAGILGEFSGQMEQAEDVTEKLLPAVRMTFRKHRVVLEDLLVLKYGDGHREAFLTARTGNGRCVTVKDSAALFDRRVQRLYRHGTEDTDHAEFLHGAADRKGELSAAHRECKDTEGGGRDFRR